jgi:hypothetical protein
MNRVVKIDPNVVFTEIDDAAVLLHLETKRYFTLNSTGVVIWQSLTAGKSEAEIIDILAAQYEAPRTQLAASVARLLNELAAAKLIEIIT